MTGRKRVKEDKKDRWTRLSEKSTVISTYLTGISVVISCIAVLIAVIALFITMMQLDAVINRLLPNTYSIIETSEGRLFGTADIESPIIASETAGWSSAQLRGPLDRPTFTLQRPADYIVFNSMLGNPAVLNGSGDERDFVLLSPNRDIHNLTNELIITCDGQEVYIAAFIHNNQSSRYNAVTGPAQNVHISFEIPSGPIVSGGRNVMPIIGTISSVSANPIGVWDNATVVASQPFSIVPIEDTAQFAQVGQPIRAIANPAVDGGTNLGDIFGCTEYQGWVTFRVRIEFE